MKSSEFVGKFKSKYLWGNLAAMALVVILLCMGLKYGLKLYTHHGESIAIPDIRNKQLNDAERILDNLGLQVVVTDTGYVKTLPPKTVLAQTPGAGEHVKSGHIVYLTINASHSPTIALPDVIDNSSLREAMAKLTAMGFKLGEPKYIPGERDWVYGILVHGKNVATGDRISIEDLLVILAGNGERDSSEDVDYVGPAYSNFEEDNGDVDEFQEITGTEEQPTTVPSESKKGEKEQEQKTDKKSNQK